MTPTETILGKKGDPVKCNQFIHWFTVGAKVGDKCLCGQTFKQIKGKLRKAKTT